jgi:kynureninase
MLSTNTIRNDFSMNDSIYLLNHSVGRPLKTSESNADELFFKAWKSNEPWHDWMQVFTDFQNSISQLLQQHPTNFCPQTNVSSCFYKSAFFIAKK